MNHFGNSKNLKQSGDKMVLTLEDIIEMSEKPIYIKSPTYNYFSKTSFYFKMASVNVKVVLAQLSLMLMLLLI